MTPSLDTEPLYWSRVIWPSPDSSTTVTTENANTVTTILPVPNKEMVFNPDALVNAADSFDVIVNYSDIEGRLQQIAEMCGVFMKFLVIYKV